MRNTGTVVRFDRVRGYGFVEPDGGGDDVFLHANDLEFEKSDARAGVRVTFGVEAGERGQFATAVRLADEPGAPASGAQASHPRPQTATDDDYYDVLSPVEFRHLVTELLLNVQPPLTSEQILDARERLTELGRRQGWLDDL